MIQADAIPDWAVYILVAPFVPIAGTIHYSLGVLQIGLLIFAITDFSRKQPSVFNSLVRVYVFCLLVPNIAVVIWGIMTDPAL